MSYEPNVLTTLSMTNEYNLNASDEFEGMSADALAGVTRSEGSFEAPFQ
jgi:hypothetical protein